MAFSSSAHILRVIWCATDKVIPDAAADRSNSELWGLSGERAAYLYERQLAGEGPNERHADWWCWTLREALQRYAGCKADTVLPDGAPGAVVVTGDDDQAFLETYIDSELR